MRKLLVRYRHLFIISFSLSESVVLGFWLWSAPSWLCISASDITIVIVIVMVVTVHLVEQEWKRQLMDYRRASAHVDKQLSPQLKEWLWYTVPVSRSAISDSLRLHDYSPPGSSVHGISQARILEWVAIPFSGGSSPSRDWICITGRFFTVYVTKEVTLI